VSLHRVDARFLLPEPVRTAFVAGDSGWTESLRGAGVDVSSDPRGRHDLAVASSGGVTAALAAGSEMVIVEGRGGRRKLARAGYVTSRILPLPSVESPILLLPLDYPAASSYALEHWTLPRTTLKRVRQRLVQALVEREALPPFRLLITVGLQRAAASPFVIHAAAAIGVSPDVEWFLVSRPEYELGRGHFVVFPRGSSMPTWVVKFARVRGYGEPFESDERGLRLAREAPAAIAARAPQLLGRFEVDGLQASVESAAVGRRMDSFLATQVDRSMKEALIERVAEWVLELGRGTRSGPVSGMKELERLARDTVPPWVERGVPANLVEHVASVPAVLQHNDLGCWNIVTDGRAFTVLDWESANRHGLPLWDLWYFLADALACLDRALDTPARARHFVQLFRGELPASRTLFLWTRRMVEALGIPSAAVGPLATLCWLHHARSHESEVARLRQHSQHGVAPEWVTVQLPELWLREAALGSSWHAWNA
jgi:hypothetical protein